jgi:hypothetical protein
MSTVWTPTKIGVLFDQLPAIVSHDYLQPDYRHGASVAGLFHSMPAAEQAAFLRCIESTPTLAKMWSTMRETLGPFVRPGGWEAPSAALVVEAFYVDVAPVRSIICHLTGRLFIECDPGICLDPKGVQTYPLQEKQRQSPVFLESSEFNLVTGSTVATIVSPSLASRAESMRRADAVMRLPKPVHRTVSFVTADKTSVGSMSVPLWLPDQAAKYLTKMGLHPL